MIDLALRIEESLSLDDYEYLARHSGVKLEKDFFDNVFASYDKKKAKEFSKYKELAFSLLKKEENIEYAFASVIHRLYREGYLYVEIMFNPTLYQCEELSLKKVTYAALRGLNNGLKGTPGFEANIILTLDREVDNLTHKQIFDLAKDFQGERIVAIGLEDNDSNKALYKFKSFFEQVKKANIPIVICLGKNSDEKDMKTAIELGANRIVGAYEFPHDYSFVQEISKLARPISFCLTPSIDLLTGKIDDYSKVNLKDFYKFGLMAYIAARGNTIAQTSMKKEFIHLLRHCYQFSRDDVYQSMLFSINSAFIDQVEKTDILNECIRCFQDFYLSLI